jgi:hypothetical protein
VVLPTFPVRLAAQTKMIDVHCFKTSGMSDSNQRLMQAFLDEEPHASLSRELSAKDFLPNLSAFAELWVRSIKSQCLSKLIPFGEGSLRRAVTQFIQHYHLERPHQGKGNRLLFRSPVSPPSPHASPIKCHQRLGGLLKFYQRAA